MLTLECKSIGVVRELGGGDSLLELRPPFAEGLFGLRAGDQVQVLYWMHNLTSADRRRLRVHPGGDAALPERGVFALRSCVRPNPIGVTVVEVIEVRPAALVVRGLDALVGSPVLDIKLLSA